MDKEDGESSTSRADERDGKEKPVDEFFDGEETGNGDSTSRGTQTSTGQSATGPNQTASEQLDWNMIISNLENITNLISEYFEQARENKQVENERKVMYFKHQRQIILTAALTFIIVIVTSAGMTVYGALSGDAFTFVLGTLFGAILTFLQNMMGKNGSED